MEREIGTRGDEIVLAVIGDIHAHWRRLERVLARIAEERIDGILLVGDLGTDPSCRIRGRSAERDARYQASLEAVLARTTGLGKPVLFVPGNHDLREIAHEGNVDGKCATIAGSRSGLGAEIRVGGIGGAGPERFGFPYEWDEEEIRARSLPACDVLLCHAPPARTPIDALAGDRGHAGSEALREVAERHDGVYVCGHIHESPGAVQLGRCLCLNVGGLGEPYGRAQVGFVRRSSAFPKLYELVHEDLETGRVQRWQRA